MPRNVNNLGLLALMCLCLGIYVFAILGMYASWAIVRPIHREGAGFVTVLVGIGCFALGSVTFWRVSLRLAKMGGE